MRQGNAAAFAFAVGQHCRANRVTDPQSSENGLHGTWLLESASPITRTINRRTLAWNNLTIAVSDEVRESMDEQSRSQTVVIPNGIDCAGLAATANEREAVCAEFGIPAGDFVIVKVANLSPVKHHEMLIRAFALTRQRSPIQRCCWSANCAIGISR